MSQTLLLDLRQTIESRCSRGSPTCPSIVRYAVSLSAREVMVITMLSGTITGRFVNICGQIGVIQSASTFGKMIGPPADNEYAVEPVGVETMRPSAL